MSALIYLIKVCTCQIIFYIFYRIIIKRETHFSLSRLYLLFGIGISFIIPFISQMGYLFFKPAQTYMAPINEFIFNAEYVSVVTRAEPTHQLLYLLISLYVIGFLTCICKFLYGIFKIISINKSSQIEKHPLFKIAKTGQDMSTFSFLNTIYIPGGIRDIDQSVLSHELAHIQGRHTYDILFIEIVKSVLWFNPIIYLTKNELRELHEYIADQEVLNTGQLAQYYQQLLQQSLSDPSLELALPFNRSNIKNRIIMMNKEKSAKWKKYKYLCILPIIGLLISAFTIDDRSFILSPNIDTHINFADSIPVYKMVDEMPRFPGCEAIEIDIKKLTDCADKKLLQYIYTNVAYPPEARSNGIQGQAIISFIINQDGTISDAKIVKDPGAGLGQEALRVVILMSDLSDRWVPGRENGKAVRVQYNLPIKFKLESETKYNNTAPLSSNNEKLNGSNDTQIPIPPTPPEPPTDLDVPPAPPAPPSAPPSSPVVEEIFKIVETMPRFPGCEHLNGSKADKKSCADKKMLQYIYKNIKYPAQAKEKGIDGQVVISFVVERNGDIVDARVLRGPGSGLNEEALRVVNTMNNMPEKWTPGKQRGKPVRVQYNIPIKYKLEKNKDETDLYKTVDEMPRFPGCESIVGSIKEIKKCADNKMLQYLFSHLKYPEEAYKKGLEGTVIISFNVNTDGSISDSHILKDVAGGLGTEALRVINAMNSLPDKWIPGKIKGKPVNVQYSVPIKFKLPNNSDK